MMIQELSGRIVRWYTENKRNFPWRDTGDVYDVWVSEIMLQQTRIPVVTERFTRFKQRFPDLWSLAEASWDEVFKEWEGLGYYSRARNLKRCAKMIVREYAGRFPAGYDELRKLPGIGEYTAAAIASIVYGEKVPLIDGNVKRVIARLYGITDDVRETKTEKKIRILLEEHLRTLPEEDTASFNVGIMELGEVLCLPNAKPLCEGCPLKDVCAAKKENRTREIPVLSPKKKRGIEQKTVLVIRDENAVYLEKRPEKGLLSGLYEPIMKEGHRTAEEVFSGLTDEGFEISEIVRLPDAVHVFSHKEWHMTGYLVRLRKEMKKDRIFRVTKEEESRYAIPSAFAAYREYFWNQEVRL